MRKKADKNPSELELQILNVLWERGALTVREVLEALPVQPQPAYTTVLTMMRLMHEKGYLTRREQGKAHLYQAKLREQPVKQGLLHSLLNAGFRGSVEEMMVRLLEDEEISRGELSRIKQLIEQKERGDERSKSSG